MAAAGNVCVPADHGLDERELLLKELQQRMTRAVLESPEYEACLRSPRDLYRTLAGFFEAQHAEAQQAAQLALSAANVRRVWAFCVNVLHQRSEKAAVKSTGDKAVEALHSVVVHGPSIPLEALQQPAPYVTVPEHHYQQHHELQQQQLSCSLFSILRRSLSCLLDLCYVADCRLRGSPSAFASPTLLSVISLGAVCASLVPTLDRVQAVRAAAQLADDVWNNHRANAHESAAPAPGLLDPFFPSVALFLAGVWSVWAALDVEHATPLRTLAETLVHDAAVARGASAPFFASWLQQMLRSSTGRAALQQLCAEPASIAQPTPPSTPRAEAPREDVDTAREGEDDFWLRLAS